MNITCDTNVLVRLAVLDDPKQSRVAVALMESTDFVVVSLVSMCELVWVLRSVYGFDRDQILAAIERLLNSANIVVDRSAVELGIAMMRSGGDFADGLIAFDGARSGGGMFVSFDKKAVLLLSRQGHAARLLAT